MSAPSTETTVRPRPYRLATGVLLGLGTVLALATRRVGSLSTAAPDLRGAATWIPRIIDNRLALAVVRRLNGAPTEVLEGVEHSVVLVPGEGGHQVPVHLYQEVSRGHGRRGALLWVHAGGLVMGTAEQDHQWCSRIARDAGVLVASVDYRLAPEHPFPAAHDDCVAALRWLVSSPDLEVDGSRVAVGGASAGGGLAAAVVQRMRDTGEVPVAFQALVYPMLDDRTTMRCRHHGRGRLGWTPRSNWYAWRSYLKARPGRSTPGEYAVPGRREDLAGLPPAWIGVGDIDLFYAENVAYASRLADAGVPHELWVETGMPHGADVLLAGRVPRMEAFQERVVDEVRAVVGA